MATITTTLALRDEMTAGFQRIEAQVQRLSGQLGNAGKHAEDFGMRAMKIGGVALAAGAAAVSAFTKVAGSIRNCTEAYAFQAEQETKLETVMRRRMGAGEQELEMIRNLTLAQENLGIYSQDMMMAGAQELATYIDNVDTLKTLIPALNDMVAQGAGFGANAGTMQSYATMIGKVMGGSLGGMSERGYVFTEAEKQMFKEMDEAQKALFLAKTISESIGNQNEALAGTATGQIVQMTNQINRMYKQIGKNLEPVMTAIRRIGIYAQSVLLPPFVRFSEWVSRNAPKIARVFAVMSIGIVAALAAITLHMIKLKREAILSAVSTMKAWVIAHLPFVLITAAIIAIIVVALKMGATMEDIGGVVGRVFGTLYVTIYNVVVMIQNILATLAEFFLNVFKDPVGAVGRLFFDLFDGILGMVETLAAAIDGLTALLPGMETNMSGAVAGFRSQMQGLKNSLFGSPDLEIARWQLKTTADIDMFEAKGRSGGRTLESLFSEAERKMIDSVLGGNTPEFAFDSGGNLMTSVQNKVGVEISDDYRKLLNEQATRQYLIKYNQNTIKPNLRIDNVNVTGGLDVEAVIDEFSTGVQNMAGSSLL